MTCMQLLKYLKNYKPIHIIISNNTLRKFLGHIGTYKKKFAFFDENVAFETKRKIVDTLQNEGIEYPIKRICVESGIVFLKKKKMKDISDSEHNDKRVGFTL